NIVVIAEQAHHLVGLAGAHQAGVDEDASELVADRFMDQHAATEESTPPDRPQMTLARPTCFLMRSTAAARKACMFHSGSMPAMLRTKLARMVAPRGVCATSGWNC